MPTKAAPVISLDTRASESKAAADLRRTQADAWAVSLAPTVAAIIGEGYFGLADLAEQLSARALPTRRGGRWSPNLAGKLCRRLIKLGLMEHPKLRGRYIPPTHTHRYRQC